MRVTTTLAQSAPSHHSAAAAPGACPFSAQIGAAALGKLNKFEAQALAEHLGRCEPCARERNDLVERIALWGNRLLFKPQLQWLNDSSWLKPYDKYLGPDRAQGSILRIIDRRFTLVQMARSARWLRGSTAECGVLYGVGSALICKTLETTYRDGELHWGFDSFAGLSAPSPPDLTKYAWQAPGLLATSPQMARDLLADFPFARLVQGWVPECLAEARGCEFRLVHLDLDLYRPTLEALEFFYPRLVGGAALVIDDYGHLSCLGVRAAVDEFFADKAETPLETVDGVGFVFKGQAVGQHQVRAA